MTKRASLSDKLQYNTAMNKNIQHQPARAAAPSKAGGIAPMYFIKMHGLGNDFAVFDARKSQLDFTDVQVRQLADRQRGIGFDQMVVLRQSKSAHVFMEIWNADGSKVGACGNATRCVAKLILSELDSQSCTIETEAGLLSTDQVNGLFQVNMGQALTSWRDIPLAKDINTDAVNLESYGLPAGVCTNMGNPHITFFMDQMPDDADINQLGPKVENHSLFPERVNVGFASVNGENSLRLRVWERGAGITQACGTAACAAAVAAYRRQITARQVMIELDGGILEIIYQKDGTVLMTGSATTVFEGTVRLP